MAVLEQRQATEEQKKIAEIRAALAPPRSSYQRLQPLDTGQHRMRMEGRSGAGGTAGGHSGAGAGASPSSPTPSVGPVPTWNGGAGTPSGGNSPTTTFAAARAATASALGTAALSSRGGPLRSPGAARAMVLRQAAQEGAQKESAAISPYAVPKGGAKSR